MSEISFKYLKKNLHDNREHIHLTYSIDKKKLQKFVVL